MPRTSELANLRDVGGLRTMDGRVLRSGEVLRSDAPHPGDAAPELAGWPPATVLDLRSPDELHEAHPLAGSGAHVVSVALATEASTRKIADSYPDLRTLYNGILEGRGSLVAEAVGHVARADGPILVHCAAGKDRTGIVIAAVLAAVGVEREAIVEDYHRTEVNMPGVLDRVAADPDAMDELTRIVTDHPELVSAPRGVISEVLDTFAAARGGATGWLVANGLPADDLVRLRERLLAA